MSASQANAVSGIAFQLIAALEAYLGEVEQLAQPRPDPETFHHVRLRLDEMRLYSASLPGISVAWVELLIRHFELAHSLWQAQQGLADPGAVGKVQSQHAEAAVRLRQHCVTLLHESNPPERA
jgi:hypothetical protein